MQLLDFADRLRQFLRDWTETNASEPAMSTTEALEHIKAAMQLGLTLETTIATYVLTAQTIGPNSNKMQSINELLGSSIPEDEKAAAIRNLALEHLHAGA
ncbi:hypothetical protein WMF37_52420 [Sorangium sp. So ce291]|uniref:hypothetical protein n=1 Tax=Sorangium sp. So ce291 TaxID=3133294 RepID=UPI003F5D99E5